MNLYAKLFIVCILMLYSGMLVSQTFLIPQIGVNLHYFKFNNTENVSYTFEDNTSNFDGLLGLEIKQQLIDKWNIAASVAANLSKHSYVSINDFGIIPKYDHYYRFLNFDLRTGYMVLNNMELGIGYCNVLFYENSTEYPPYYKEELANSNSNLYLVYTSYNLKRFVFDVSYSSTVNNKSDEGNFSIVSLKIGYWLKILDKLKRKKKVNCPKI